MRNPLFFAILLLTLPIFSQEVHKENLTPKETLYWDFNKTQIQASGSYYKNSIETTDQKHGRWVYFDRYGQLEEERNYYKDMLHGKVTLYHPNKKIRQEGYFILGKQDSIYREFYENGKLSVEGNYKQNTPTGLWTYYYLDGREKSVEEVKDGYSYIWSFWLPDSLHTQTIVEGTGEMATYHTNGTVKEWYNFKNGLKDGPFEEISVYGYVTLQGFFKEGDKDSTWTYTYYTGDLEKISNYKHGKLNGDYIYYYDNGQVNVTGLYSNGQKSGKWFWYTNKGTVDMEGEFQQDKQHGDWTYYYPSGELSYKAHYQEDKKSGHWIYYYKDGRRFKEGDFKNDQKEGTWNTWYENGQLLMTGAYKEGKETGEWINNWDNGKLKNKSSFTNGVLDGEWISAYPNGKTKMTGKYDNGFQTGEWVEYFENGRQKDIITYKIFKEKTKIDYGIMKNRERLESKKDGHAVSFSSKDFGKTEEGDYKEGLKEGEWIAYHQGGKIPAVISNYKNGALNGAMKQFDRRGKLLQEITYKEGLKHGKFVVYSKRGSVLVEKTFENGMEVISDEEKKSGSFAPK